MHAQRLRLIMGKRVLQFPLIFPDPKQKKHLRSRILAKQLQSLYSFPPINFRDGSLPNGSNLLTVYSLGLFGFAFGATLEPAAFIKRPGTRSWT